MSNDSVTTAIEDSLNDFTAEITADAPVETAVDTTVDTVADTVDAGADVTVGETAKPESMQVQSPGAKVAEATRVTSEDDDFAKEFGLNPKSITGAPNRIPYDRVVKIVKNAKTKAAAAAKVEYEKEFQPRLKEYETKVSDYEGRLTRVFQFEHILENEPKQFLEMLSQVPAYKEFFAHISQLAANANGSGKAESVQGQPEKLAADVDPNDPRPMPNIVNPDGSRVYDLDGLDQLMSWNARQVTKQVTSQIEKNVSARYAPIEEEWKRREYINKVTPQIDNQIAEARTWDRFAELEPKVIELLNKDPKFTLEKAYMVAYQQNVVPRLTNDHNKVRETVLAELRKKPSSTAAPVTRTSARQVEDSSPKSLHDIIAAEVAKIS